MSNFSSLLASISGGTSVGGKKGTTGINIKAGQDLSALNKLISSLGDVSGELGKEFVELETSRGKGQTAGSIIGGLLGFTLSGGQPWAAAAGAGFGGYGGGHLATRKDVSDIMRQKREKERLLANVKDTWFHSSKREGTQKTGRDIDRYISSANTQLKDRLFKNALLDAAGAFIGAGKFNKWDPKGTGSTFGDFIRKTDAEGDKLGVFGGIKEYFKDATSKASAEVVPVGLSNIKVDPSTSNKYMGSGSFFDIAGGPISGRGTGRGILPGAMTLADIVGYDPTKHILPTPRKKPQFGSILNEEENLLSDIFSGQGIIKR